MQLWLQAISADRWLRLYTHRSYIPVNFNQAIGATTPFFTAILAYLFQVGRVAQGLKP